MGLLDSVLDLKCFSPLVSPAGEEVSQLKAFMKKPEGFPHKQLPCVSVCNLVEMKAGERRSYQMWQYSIPAVESPRETSYLQNKPVLKKRGRNWISHKALYGTCFSLKRLFSPMSHVTYQRGFWQLWQF